ncbi:hypothetical protein BKA82DRAFT_4094676 [Pisolithus tinctorius]|nr:hypothetical protein BKA82DRAFT_4094676 [Pisolithus tinctorius]
MVRSSDVVLILVAIIFPPAAAAFVSGCSCDLCINICLTILGYFPGLLHSLWLIYKKMQAEERYGRGGFVYVGNGTYQPVHNAPNAPPANYGATA